MSTYRVLGLSGVGLRHHLLWCLKSPNPGHSPGDAKLVGALPSHPKLHYLIKGWKNQPVINMDNIWNVKCEYFATCCKLDYNTTHNMTLLHLPCNIGQKHWNFTTQRDNFCRFEVQVHECLVVNPVINKFTVLNKILKVEIPLNSIINSANDKNLSKLPAAWTNCDRL